MSALLDFSAFISREDTQTVTGFEEKVQLNSRYLKIIRREDDVLLILTSGIPTKEKEREYSLSTIYLPFNSSVKSITQTPYAVLLLKLLNQHVTLNNPVSATSYKGFSDKLRISCLIIEYFAIRGHLSLSSVSEKDVKHFINDIRGGWFNALNFGNRFIKIDKAKHGNWFVSGAPKNNRSNFVANNFCRDIGSSLIRRTLNSLPTQLAHSIKIPTNLRTPYKYNGENDSDTPRALSYFSDIFLTLNSLFGLCNKSSPIHAVEKLASEYASVYSKRTPTVTPIEVAKVIHFLKGTLNKETRDVLTSLSVTIREAIQDPSKGSWKENNAINDAISSSKPIFIGGKAYTIDAYASKRGNKESGTLSLVEAYKVYKAAVAIHTIIFTGWRLEEIVSDEFGITESDFDTVDNDNLTLIERYVEKESVSEFSKETTVIGLQAGKELKNLAELNKACSVDYDVASSLFRTTLEGRCKTTDVRPEFSSRVFEQNPIHQIAKESGIEIPTSKELRRFFAVLYFYQFDNPDLLSLSNHFGHDSLETTTVYVTNSNYRKTSHEIEKTMPVKMINTSHDTEMAKILDDARNEKLISIITNAMGGMSTSGFQATCRAIWKKLFQDTEYESLNPIEQEKNINQLASKMRSDGYSVDVFAHGNCTNSEKLANSREGNCVSSSGDIEREHASASFCSGCSFHDVQPQHLDNIKAIRNSLSSTDLDFDIDDIFSENVTPLETLQRNEQIEELDRIIKLYEKVFNDDEQ